MRPGRKTPGDRRRLIAAVLLLLLVVGSAVFAFGRRSIAPGGYTVRAIFSDAQQLKGGSAVRTSGLDIGRVESTEASSDGTALVTMRLKADTRRPRRDDRFVIRPRLAFEGNFYVDIMAGSPAAPTLPDGAVVPRAQTSTSVQLDEVLSTLTAPIRDSSKSLVAGLATGLGAGQGSAGTLLSGATGLRRATRELDRALESVRGAARGFRGTGDGDLGRALADASAVTRDLARNPRELATIIDDYATVVGALVAQDRQLRRSIPAARSFLAGAPASLRRIDAVLPSLRRFAVDLRPVLRELPRQLPSLNAVFAQVASTALPGELDRFVATLRQPVLDLPQLERQLAFVLPYGGPLGRCLTKVVVPALEQRVPDAHLTVKQPVWLEALHMAANLAASSPGFDGNGTTVRAGISEGEGSLLGFVPGITEMVSVIGGSAIEGVSPQWLGTNVWPTVRIDRPCEDQAVPNLANMTAGEAFAGFRKVSTKRLTEEQRENEAAKLATLRDALRGREVPRRPVKRAGGHDAGRRALSRTMPPTTKEGR
ncbi:MAG: MlaD family protein [Solirubrobacteraceae bacterium]